MSKAEAYRGLTRRTLGGLFWTSSGTAVESVVQVLVTIVLARLLAPADFGLVAAAGIFLGFCTIFANLGVGPALIQRENLGARHLRTGFTVSMVFGLLFAAVVVLFAPLISRFFRMPALTHILWAVAPAFIIRSLSLVSESLLRRELRFRFLANISVAAFVIGEAIVAIGLAWLGFGAWALIIGQLVETIVNSIALMIARPHPKRLAINGRAFRDLMYFGGWITASRIGNFFALRGDYMVTGRWLGAGALGFYSRAYALIATPANLFASMGDQVLFPTMAKIQNEPPRLAAAFRRGMVLISLLTIPVSAAIFILAPEIVHVLFGPKWKPVVGPLKILSLGIFFRTGYKMSGVLARAKGTVLYLALVQALYAILVVGGAWIGKSYGITGIAVGVLAALLIHFLLMSRLSLKELSISWKDFFLAHVPALTLTSVVLVVSTAAATILRSLTTNAFVILLLTVSTLLLLVYGLIRLFPETFLGKDGIWWLQTLSQNLRQTVQDLWITILRFIKKKNRNIRDSYDQQSLLLESPGTVDEEVPIGTKEQH